MTADSRAGAHNNTEVGTKVGSSRLTVAVEPDNRWVLVELGS